MESIIRDINLAESGRRKINWVRANMPVLNSIEKDFKRDMPFKGVKVESVNGAIEINVFICVKQGVKVKDVAQAVQESVKDKIQTMTGTAVTRVNVNIADIEIEAEEPTEEQ